MDSRYPAWLGQALLDSTFRWDKGVLVDMPTFLAHYTLHDSYWMGLYLQPSYGYTALLAWDTFWSKERIPFGKAVGGGGFPLLVIDFEYVYQVLESKATYKLDPPFRGTTIIGDATSAPLTDAERTALFESWDQIPHIPDNTKQAFLEPALYRTHFLPALGGHVDILHAGETRFLCLDWDGNPLPIPLIP